MKVLMLGWEYPPHISGGLGTACEGLTIGLARCGVSLTFVVPRVFGGENASHMQLLDPYLASLNKSQREKELQKYSVGSGANPSEVDVSDEESEYQAGFLGTGNSVQGIESISINSALSPYQSPQLYREFLKHLSEDRLLLSASYGLSFSGSESLLAEPSKESSHSSLGTSLTDARYGQDLFQEVSRYTAQILHRFSKAKFDVVHAHDWMTFPAAVAIAEATGKPLVTHIHSVERDRSGDGLNHQIAEIEAFGLHRASKVIAVSHYTKNIIAREYGIPSEKVGVVHNGVYSSKVVEEYKRQKALPSKIVLFLGRVTFQKGPDYFVEAAAKVVQFVPDVLFVMAGSGDMLQPMINRVRELGIEQHFFFTGFLKGNEVEQMFSLADVYVMPSVSEPFGISALESVNYNTPVIVSKQSGVSEVLAHALKVDFWDTDQLADMIVNALEHEELREDMVRMAREEVKRLQWDESAKKTISVYQELLS